MVTKSNAYKFILFGFHFLIWKKPKRRKSNGGGGVVAGSCKIVRNGDYISIAMPDGTLIPHQIDLRIKSNVNEAATATVKMFITID